MTSPLITAALVLSSSLIGPSSHLGADAFSPLCSSASAGSCGSASSVFRQHPAKAATALHLSGNQPSGPSADSIVSVYGGNGSGANNGNGGGNKRRRSGRNGTKRRSTGGTGGTSSSPNRSNRRRGNNKNQNRRRSNSPNRQSSAGPVARSAAETAKSREQHLALRSKLEEMQQRNGQGEELSRE